MQNRRAFLGSLGTAATGLVLSQLTSAAESVPQTSIPDNAASWFDMSLAQWSLHKDFWSGARDKMRFAAIAKHDFGLNAIEYVNQFYLDGFPRT